MFVFFVFFFFVFVEFTGGLFGNISVLNLILIQRNAFLDNIVSVYLLV